jgi:hypothetical protein
MDITFTDTDGISHSSSDADLIHHYLATSNTPTSSSSSTNPPPWRAADTSYELGHFFNTPSTFNHLDIPWSEETADRYLVADHSFVDIHGGDLDLPLSDHSYSTPTRSDSGSRASSKSYTHTSMGLPHDAELGFIGAGEHQWQNIPSPYGGHGQEIHLPHLQLVDAARPSMYLPEIDQTASHYLPPSSSLPQVSYHTPDSAFTPSTQHYHTPSQYHTPPSVFLPSREIFDDHHFLAPSALTPTPSPHSSSEEQHRYVSIAQLTGSYVPDAHKNLDHGQVTGSPRNRGRGRGRGRGASPSTRGGRGRGAGRGGRHVISAVPPDSQIASPVASQSHLKRRRPSYTSSSSSANTATSSSDDHDQGESAVSPPKRARQGNGKAKAKANTPTWSEDEAEYGDDGEEDVYIPSRSASPDQVSASDYSNSGSPKSPFKRRIVQKGKNKMPNISAAEALAQVAARYSNGGSAENDMGIGYGIDETERDGNGEWQPLPLPASTSVQGSSTSTSRGRRNGTIALPVPVPHLTKKSRGRKVPYVDMQMARGGSAGASASAGTEDGDSDGTGDGDGAVRGSSIRRGRGGPAGAGGSGGRSFVCQVPGCGKCFVRGEHLKRHVRSIHTNEKRRGLSSSSFS